MMLRVQDKSYEDTELGKVLIQTNIMFERANTEKPTGIQVSINAIKELLPFVATNLHEAITKLNFNAPHLFRAKIAGYQISSALDLKQGEYRLEFKHKD